MKTSVSTHTVFAAIAAGALLAACHSNKPTLADHQVFAPPPTPTVSAIAPTAAPLTNAAPVEPSPPTPEPSDAIARIQDEGANHSQVMATLSYLSDVIGQRLTGSPNLKRANEWTRATLASWGLTNAHLESWGPFGRGWELKHFSAQIVSPQVFPLIAAPQAWSPGLAKPLVANVYYMGDLSASDLDHYKGKLAGAIVLAGPTHPISPRFEPLATRQSESNLVRLADASGAARGRRGGARGGFRGRAGLNENRVSPAALLSFLNHEKVGVVVNCSAQGEDGTIFVAQATVPAPYRPDTATTNGPATTGLPGRRGGGAPATPRAWSADAPAMAPEITLAAEDYNRLTRMIQQGEKLKMEVDLKVQFHDEDLNAYNTIAEIPGADLKDQIVMLGGHMDSWQAGTGATDNGAGVAASMEAVRIIQACHLQPRRTIRIALWTGEEEGLLGSHAYVSHHFGYFGTNAAAQRRLIRGPEYENLSVYFNLDNGAGKIRGVYMQNNEGVRPLFRRWLEPFHSLGAETLTASGTGSTDHVSFDAIGLPGFQFIQDPLEYGTRTHHSNQDVFDRVPADDMKQSATIIAAFVYQAAMLPEKLPRKPAPE